MNSTPNTADAAGEDARARPTTKTRWDELLAYLTSDELNQYGAMAEDQLGRERRWRPLHAVLLVVSLAVFVWLVRDVVMAGLDWHHLYGLVLVAMLVYWPYRSRKTQRLWRGHRAVIDGELARRESTPVKTDKESSAEPSSQGVKGAGGDET